MKQALLITTWLAMACIIAPGRTSAGPAVDPAVAACRTIDSDESRLSCYDRIVDAAGESTDRVAAKTGESDSVPGGSSAADEPDADDALAEIASEPGTESSQGPSEELFGEDRETLQKAVERATGVKIASEVSSTVRALGYSGRGRLVVRLENGQIWDQVDSGRMTLNVGDEVVIRRAALGSYALRKSGKNRSIKVRRRTQN